MKLTIRPKLLSLSVYLYWPVSLATVASHAPNFIIMYIDDLGWADTSVPMMDSELESKSDFYRTQSIGYAWDALLECLCAGTTACHPARVFNLVRHSVFNTHLSTWLANKRKLKVDEVSMADAWGSGKGYVTAHFGKGMAARERMSEIGYDVTDEYDVIRTVISMVTM